MYVNQSYGTFLSELSVIACCVPFSCIRSHNSCLRTSTKQTNKLASIVSHRSETVYWVRDRKASLKATIGPNEKVAITTMLSHEWWVRDARTDTRGDGYTRSRMAADTCLYNIKVTSNTRTEYTIPKRECFDRSGHCSHWNRRGTECSRNPTFMYEHCASTCNRCTKEDPVDTGEKTKNNTDEETESSAKDEL